MSLQRFKSLGIALSQLKIGWAIQSVNNLSKQLTNVRKVYRVILLHRAGEDILTN
jgi:hypothetical protein